MQKKLIALCILLFFISFSENLYSQYKFSYFKQARNDAGISYNFFSGPDADAFSTTINGFGSGFFFDLFTGRYSFDAITLGDKKTSFSLGVGFAISKYRFSDNLVITKTGEQIEYFEDPAENHDYGNGFFSYGKSKLMYGSVYFPLYFNVNLKEVKFSAGAFLDQYITGRLKRKYKEDGNKRTEIVKNKDFNDFYLNKTKYGIDASIKHIKSGVGLGFTFMLTPFFDENHGPSIYERRITMTLDLKKFAEKKVNEKKPEINL